MRPTGLCITRRATVKGGNDGAEKTPFGGLTAVRLSGAGVFAVRRIGVSEQLDEIWVVVHRTQLLEELSALTETPVVPITADLTKPEERRKLKELLKEKQPEVRWLIGAAGIGKMGTYEQVREEDCREINVTALCPYWMYDTEFIGKAKSGDPGAIRHFPLAMSKGAVAKKALRDTRRGYAVSTPGPVAPLQRVLAKLVPKAGAIAIWKLLRRL